MLNIGQRRSPRYARELPIRVFGVDFQGTDFVEDSRTLVVSRHGAKIRLTRKLIPEMEIRILCQNSKREGLFRVVGQAGQPIGKFSFWGVECLEPAENIYEIEDAMAASEPSPRPAPLPSPELAPKPVPQLDAKLCLLGENIYETGDVMPASEPSPMAALLPSPALAPKPIPQLDTKLSSPAENVYETGVAMPASEPSLMPAPLPSPELAPRPVPQLDGKLSSPAENVYGIGVAMPASELSPMPAPLPGPELAPKPVPQLDAKLSSKHKSSARAWLRCAKCAMRELVELDETQVQAMRKLKGVMRSCPACGATTLWKRLGL
jgi:hypothetical protein